MSIKMYNPIPLLRRKIYSILKITEKITGVDNTYFAKNGSLLFFQKIIILSLNVLLISVFAHLTDTDTYGKYQLVLSILALLSVLSLPGLNTALIRSVSMGYTSSLVKSVKVRMKWGILGSIALFFVFVYFHYFKQDIIGNYFLIAALFFPLFSLSESVISYYNGLKKFNLVVRYSLIINLATTFITILILYLTNSLFLIFLSYFIVISLAGIFFYKIATKSASDNPVDEDVINYGKKLTLMKGFSLTENYGDKPLVTYFLGFTGGAMYSVALAIPDSLFNLIKALTCLILPKASLIPEEIIYDKIKKKIWVILSFSALIVAVGWFSLPLIIPFFFGEKYTGILFYSKILLLAFFFMLINQIFLNVLQAKQKHKLLYGYYVFRSLSHIILLVVLVPLYGLIGAILSYLIFEAATTLYLMIFTQIFKRGVSSETTIRDSKNE